MALPQKRALPESQHSDSRAATSGEWETLGTGTFGVVHTGFMAGGARVAVKKLRPMWCNSPRETLFELTCLALRHPHLVRASGVCYGARTGSQLLWISMPYGGRSISDWLMSQNDEIPASTVTRHVRQILRGLEFLHSLSIYHGDLKPSNVLIHPSTGHVQICDFGAVATLHPRKAQHEYTRWYRPPEIECYRGAQAESDIWAVGCVGLELLLHTQLNRKTWKALLPGAWSAFTPPRGNAPGFSGEAQLGTAMAALVRLHMDVGRVPLAAARGALLRQSWVYADPDVNADVIHDERCTPKEVLRHLQGHVEGGGGQAAAAFLHRILRARGVAAACLRLLHLHPARRPGAALALAALGGRAPRSAPARAPARAARARLRQHHAHHGGRERGRGPARGGAAPARGSSIRF